MFENCIFLAFQTRNLVVFLEWAVKIESPNYGVVYNDLK